MGDEDRKFCPFGETDHTSHICDEDCPLWHEDAQCCSFKVAADALRKIARAK